MLEVVEFITRLEQGYTEAFLCRARDEHLYVVKSVQAGRAALIKEVIAARAGRELGLPIPPFATVYVPPAVARQAAAPELSYLGEVPGFASRLVDGRPILNPTDVPKVDDKLRGEVLLFDWWLCNDDRTDYNPNLLWDPVGRDVTVIDHNLTFDVELAAGRTADLFWRGHIFRRDRGPALSPEARTSASSAMGRVCSVMPAWWASLPDEWTAGDVAGITLDRLLSTLGRHRSDDFWTP